MSDGKFGGLCKNHLFQLGLLCCYNNSGSFWTRWPRFTCKPRGNHEAPGTGAPLFAV